MLTSELQKSYGQRDMGVILDWDIKGSGQIEIVGEISDIETIAEGRGVYIRRYLERTYGKGRWRKMKGIGTVQLADATICEAEIHWL